jgi:hypothetical protein
MAHGLFYVWWHANGNLLCGVTCRTHLWNIVLLWNRVPTCSRSILYEHALFALTVCPGELSLTAFSSDRSVDICCANCDTMVRSSLPHGGLFPKAFDSFCDRHKTVDTCFYTWIVSRIFDLAKFAFFILASIISFHYYIIFYTRDLIKLVFDGLLKRSATSRRVTIQNKRTRPFNIFT